jgi:galactokinase
MLLPFRDAVKEQVFQQIHHTRPQVLSSAPGRINLIGEHTDYNYGYVLPAAIHLRDYCLTAARSDGRVHVWADDFRQEETFDLDVITPSEQKRWANYVKGIFWVLKEEGFELSGVNAMVWGDVPLESGLSSSAALEVSVIKGLTELFGIELAPERMAKLAQKAENEFVGVKCGLMDQFISVFGRKNSALFLDCETLDFELFPLNLDKDGLCILVYDTKVRRKLASSEYNKRRQEAAEALDILKKRGASSYKLATTALLENVKNDMPVVPYRRAKHVISENERVKQAVEALKADDFSGLGRLLFQSHESLRDDYQVSCPELDLLYTVGRGFKGCLGARLVGAGFGGSGIALIQRSRIQEFEKTLRVEAAKSGFPEPGFYEVAIGEGAAAVRLDKAGRASLLQ